VAHILERLALSDAETIVDLGCGSGENTLELARRSARGTVLGIDGSPAMIEAAQRLLAQTADGLRERVAFAVGDLAQFRAPQRYSVIFSNAALQWIKDQRAVLRACFDALSAGGRIVVQIPANELETGKRELSALAGEPRWSALLDGLSRPFRDWPPEHYASMLGELGYQDVDCYYHTFRHPMERAADVAEWYRATGLRPFLDALPADKRDEFLAAYVARLEHAYGTAGAMVFSFRRLFMWARRPSG
ncbi:MAG TPA: methyltransferase domain-containing protein, partial [Candidatus Binataceae bacterium]|nr:methyltransferase domain-containing protein [Candidatus Binataceae bacterium]